MRKNNSPPRPERRRRQAVRCNRRADAPGVPDERLLARLGVTLKQGQQRALVGYAALVDRWNALAGLVSEPDLERFAHRHLLNCLTLAPLIRAREWRAGAPAADAPTIADFGSGAGLPGVPLAVSLPEISFALIERSTRKARFLQRVRDELKLQNLKVVCADVSELPPLRFRAVVTRAAMPVSKLWPHARAVLEPGGYLLLLDKIVRTRQAPTSGLPDGCECGGAAVRRHWIHIPELAAWHGVLEFGEASR